MREYGGELIGLAIALLAAAFITALVLLDRLYQTAIAAPGIL